MNGSTQSVLVERERPTLASDVTPILADDASLAHVCIVGAGHAGGRTAQQLRALGHRGRITLIGDEAHAPYERPELSKGWLTMEDLPWSPQASEATSAFAMSSLALGPADFWDEAALRDNAIDRIHGRVVSLDTVGRALTLANGTTLAFDRLVVCTGGAPRNGAVPGADLAGVHLLRTIDDSLALREALATSRGLVVIGAGVIGMEVAASARTRGVPVTVIESGSHVMARCLPPSLSDWLATLHRRHGVHLEMGVSVSGITRVDAGEAATPAGNVDSTLRLRVTGRRDGQDVAIAADTVLIAIGVDCAPAFLADTGLADPGGVVVDEYCRSPRAPWLYAAGDAAFVTRGIAGDNVTTPDGTRQETWRNAENQALAVAEMLLGRTTPYREMPWMWSDQFGRNVQVVGTPAADAEVIVRGEIDAGPASVLLVRDGAVCGGVLIDAGRDRRALERLVAAGVDVDLEKVRDTAVPLKAV